MLLDLGDSQPAWQPPKEGWIKLYEKQFTLTVYPDYQCSPNEVLDPKQVTLFLWEKPRLVYWGEKLIFVLSNGRSYSTPDNRNDWMVTEFPYSTDFDLFKAVFDGTTCTYYYNVNTFENLIQNKKAVPAKFFLFKLVSQEIRTKFEIITNLDPKEPVAVPQSATAKQTRKPRRHVWFNQQNPQISSAQVQAQEAENRRLEAEREQRLAVKSLFGRELNEAHIPLRCNNPQKQPDGLKLQLYKYQLDALTWMKIVEEDSVALGLKHSTLVPWRTGETKILFNLMDQDFVEPTTANLQKHTKNLKPKGGILADEMGLGKTLSVLGLILAHKHDPNKVDLTAEEDTKYFRTKGTLVICPNHLAKQWADEIKNHTEPALTTIVITTKAEYKSYSYGDILAADVVIVSFQFFKNPNYFWFSKQTKAKTVTEKSLSHRETCHKSALTRVRKSASGGLKIYGAALEHFYWNRIIVDEAHEILDDKFYMGMLSLLRSSYRWYVTGTPFPNAASLLGASTLISLNSEVGNVDGTEGLEIVPNIAENPVFDKNLNLFSPLKAPAKMSNTDILYCRVAHRAYRRWSLFDLMINNLFWRHTKISTKDELTIPAVVEELTLRDFSDVERAMYVNALKEGSEMRLRQLCCHPQVSSEDRKILGEASQSLDEVRDKMIKHKQDIKNSLAEKIAKHTQQIEDEETRLQINALLETNEKKAIEMAKKVAGGDEAELKKLTKPMTENQVRNAHASIQFMKGKIKEAENEMKANESMLSYFKSTIPKSEDVKKETPNCVICYEDIKEITITTCGHIFCDACIRSAIQTSACCPMCRTALSELDLQKVIIKALEELMEGDENPNLPQSKELTGLIQKYGTKMGNLIYYLRNLWKKGPSKVIIFSQWDQMLHRIGDTLRSNSIESVYVRGNVTARNKAITAFKGKDSKAKVIMLSLDNAASGTNLTEASHIFLMDPVSGTKEEALATERQAIGRAHRLGQNSQVTVVRMIIKDTVEHDLYLRNFAADDKDTAVLNNETNNTNVANGNINLDDVVPTEVEEKIAQDEMEISATISNFAKNKREAKKAKEEKEKAEEETDIEYSDRVALQDEDIDQDGVKTPEIKEDELLYKTKSQLERTPSKLLGVRRLSSSFKSPLIVRSNSLTTLLANNNNLTTSSDEIKELLSKNENLN
jgi:SNF2 family DNA or RNA helicase